MPGKYNSNTNRERVITDMCMRASENEPIDEAIYLLRLAEDGRLAHMSDRNERIFLLIMFLTKCFLERKCLTSFGYLYNVTS